MSADILAAITASAKKAADVRERFQLPAVLEAAGRRVPQGPAFHARLADATRVNIIAECKQRSPSRGILRHPYDPVGIATGYEKAGAAAISVLTEASFFDGALDDLSAIRSAVMAPLLRKDFISTPFQIVEARASGADAVLLIAGAVEQETLTGLLAEAVRQGLAALVEVHSGDELHVALAAGADLVGVNSRNLRTLDVDLRVFDDLVGEIPDGVTAVAESGIRTAEDIRRLRSSGYDAFLVGERFMTSADPGGALAELIASAEGAL